MGSTIALENIIAYVERHDGPNLTWQARLSASNMRTGTQPGPNQEGMGPNCIALPSTGLYDSCIWWRIRSSDDGFVLSAQPRSTYPSITKGIPRTGSILVQKVRLWISQSSPHISITQIGECI